MPWTFIQRLVDRERRFLVLTNNSIYTPRDLRARLASAGLHVPEESIWTSALATAQFIADQVPNGTAYVIGEAGMTTALHEVGYVLTDHHPDFVVLGETRTYSFEAITKAIRLITDGARFISTNPDPTGPSPQGPLPATGAVAALITRATGAAPYVVGKPNPMMFRSAMNRIDAHSETTAMVGDRMDIDLVAGIEAGLETVLVLTGVDPPRGDRALSLPPRTGARLDRRPRRPGVNRPRPCSRRRPSSVIHRDHGRIHHRGRHGGGSGHDHGCTEAGPGQASPNSEEEKADR